jgi:hypothetical protein
MNMRQFIPSGLAFLALVGCGSGELEFQKGKLEFSEILYDAGSLDTLEYVELKNVGDEDVALASLRLGGAVAFQFGADVPALGPGKFVVITNDSMGFATRFPGVVAFGPWVGRLSNSGEEVSIEGDSSTLASCEYGSEVPWPAMAAGNGYSLVYVGEHPNSPESWKASATLGGTPGAKNGTAMDLSVRISEVLPGQWIELENMGSKAIDISGWWITDSIGSGEPMVLGSGTSVPAHGFLVVNDSTTASTGEELFLLRTEAGAVTGSSVGFMFPALDSGSSAGLVELSDGSTQMAPLLSVTKGLPNSAPKLGALVITEIMYHPVDGRPEFLEISNTTGTDIVWFDPLDLNKKWSMEGVDMDLPLGAKVPAQGKAVLVRSADLDTAIFRTQYAVPPAAPIFGYTSKLSNSGETLRLKQPLLQVVNATGILDYAKTWSDEVSYFDDGPWPEPADGSGKSLVRTALTEPGSDPKSWTSASPTPGW